MTDLNPQKVNFLLVFSLFFWTAICTSFHF